MSPLTGGQTVLLREIPAPHLRTLYRGDYDIDVVPYLGWYQSTMEDKYQPRARWKRSLFYRLGLNLMFQSFVEQQKGPILGHTIMVVFRKT